MYAIRFIVTFANAKVLLFFHIRKKKVKNPTYATEKLKMQTVFYKKNRPKWTILFFADNQNVLYLLIESNTRATRERYLSNTRATQAD